MEDKKKAILTFTFDDICGDIVKSTDNTVEAKLKDALIEGGYIGKALRFQFAKKGGVMLNPGTISSLWQDKSGYTISMWLMPYQSLHGVWHYRLLSVYGIDDKSLLEMSYSSPDIRVKVRSSESDEVTVVFPYALKTRIPPFDAPNTNDGVWQFVVLTVDLERNSIKLYINGTEVKPASSAPIHFDNSLLALQSNVTMPDCIGGDPEEKERSFNGVMDEVKFFDYAMETSEVKKLYAGYGQSETPSVTEAQELLDALTESLGSSLIVKEGTSNVVCAGRVVKADVNDYSVQNRVLNGELYLPVNLCQRYFGTVAGAVLDVQGKRLSGKIIDGVTYFRAVPICEAKGWKYKDRLSDNGLFLMLAGDCTLDERIDEKSLLTLARFCEVGENEPTIAVEQTRVVIARSDTHAGDYTYSPSITRAGASLYASRDISCRYTEVFRSDDEGATWSYAGRVDGMWWATIFEHRGDIYLIGRYTEGGLSGKGSSYIGITRSTDGGRTWTEICRDHGAISYYGYGPHCAPTPVLQLGGRLYRAFETVTPEKEKREFVISADVQSDLLCPDSWTISDYFTGYGFPNEANAVKGPDGTVWIIARFVMNKAFLMKLNEDGTIVAARESNRASEIDFPSTPAKFTIRYDEIAKQYIGIANTQFDINCEGQRNYATLVASRDLVNWEVKEVLLCDREICHPTISVAQHAFQYVDWIFDGEDMLFVVRESAEDAANYHDSNYLTFYRIANYRNYL